MRARYGHVAFSIAPASGGGGPVPCPHCGAPLPPVPGIVLCVRCGHWSTILIREDTCARSGSVSQ